MLNFTRDYPDAETVTLDVNYRCSGQILSAAMHVIGENKKRFSKKLSTPNQVGKAVQIREFQNPREEYLAVVSELRERMENGRASGRYGNSSSNESGGRRTGRCIDGTTGPV